MAFYENKHGFDADHFLVESQENYDYPMHVHRCLELILVEEGEMVVSVEDKSYRLSAGDSVLVWANQVHSLQTPRRSKHRLCVFAPELVRRFFLMHTAEVPESPLLSAEKAPKIRFLMSQIENESDIFTAKGILYTLCGEFERCLVFRAREKNRHETGSALLTQILAYVNENYLGDCSLESIAAALRYEKTYISKFFSRSVGITLADYILQLRLAQATSLLLNTEESIIDVGNASGFNSLRTFNRNFLNRYGVTPSRYRAQKGRDLPLSAEIKRNI